MNFQPTRQLSGSERNRKRTSRLAFTFTLLAVVFSQAVGVYSQEKPPADDPPKTPATSADVRLDLPSIETRLKAADSLVGQDELKKKLVSELTQIQTYLQEEATLLNQAEVFRIDPQKVDQPPPKSGPEKPIESWREEINAGTDLKALETEHTNLTTTIEQKDVERRALDEWDDRKTKRLDELAKEIPDAEKELDIPPPTTPLAEDASSELKQARRDLIRAKQQRDKQKLNKLQLEQKYYQSESVDQKKKRESEALQADIDRLKEVEQIYQKRIYELKDQKALFFEQKITELIPRVSPPLKERTEQTLTLAKQRTGSNRDPDEPRGTISKSKETEAKSQRAQDRIDRLTKHQTSAKSYLENISRSKSLGSLLDAERALIPSIGPLQREYVSHTEEFSRYSEKHAGKELEISKLKQELDALKADPSPPQTPAIKIYREFKPEVADDPKSEARAVYELQRKVLEDLQSDYKKIMDSLLKLTTAEAELIRFAEEYRAYLDSLSMWVRVSPFYSLDDLSNSWHASQRLFRLEPWMFFLNKLRLELYNHPASSTAIVLALLVFLAIHTRLKKQVNEYHQTVASEILAPFALTRKAFGLTLILALWIPVLIGIVGYQISLLEFDNSTLSSIDQPTLAAEIRGLDGDNEAFVAGIGKALYTIAFLFGALRLTRVLCRQQGLGDIHFRWPKSRTLRVRRNLRWYVWTIVPTTFFLILVQSAGNTEERNSLGRALLSIALILTATFLYRVLAPIRPSDSRSSRVVLTWSQKLTLYIPVMVPILFLLLTLAGYSETTPILTIRLLETSVVILLLVMINEMAFRWLYIVRGKIALEQARQRQEAREQAEAETSEAPPVVDPQPTGLDLSAINVQTRNLLTTSFRLALFIALWLLWNDVTPRLGILDHQLWDSDQIIQAAQATAGDGAADPTPETFSVPGITLGDLLLFFIILAVTFVASRNLPGLLEVTVLQNLPLDTGVRYAAGMLAKYCMLAVGILIAMNVINLGVTQVSFVLGGLAVGLGFGLQELFANFVSGIILLFEQPLRIGDMVTIGDVSGTVTRIRIRATTITDWDRKEYIVPNKELITGTFRNWTLSDKLNRIVVTVGVAYGSNTEQARQLLLRICREHPKILNEPVPTAIFDEFGASALNLTLRCFLDGLEDRLSVIHELHTAIDRKFKQAGIEIAFPQMDLHLRTIDKTIEPLPLRKPELPPESQ